MRASRFVFLTSVGVTFACSVHAQSCYESSLSMPSPFMGNNDEVFKLADGSIWQVKYEYSYLYAYNPSVVICPGSGKLIINGKQLRVEALSERSNVTRNSARTSKPVKRTSTNQVVQDVLLEESVGEHARNREANVGSVIETQIAGDFSGWDGETIFKLANGQIWQQSQYAYTYHYAYKPNVVIFASRNGYEMQVEGVDSRIKVNRLK